MSILIGLLTAVHVVVALFVVLLVLMQKSSEQGVGAAFGGGMTETVFGAGTTTALVRMTIYCAGLLLLTTLSLAVLYSHRTRSSGSLMRRTLATMPAASSAPSGEAPAFPLASQPTAPTTANTTPGTPTAPAASQPPAATPATGQPASPPSAPPAKTP